MRVWPLSILLCLSVLAAMPGGVVIEGDIAGVPEPGSSTPLDIRIHKGGLDYFGRLLIQAPEGCRLEADQLFGGSFRWDPQRNVGVVSWLKLPDMAQFDIRLRLEIDEDAPVGDVDLNWEFSFIRNNDRESVRPAPLHFVIAPQSEGTQDARSATVQPASTPSVTATRTWTQSEFSSTATVRLEGLETGGFVKLEHPLPPRCTVDMLSDGGATVRQEGGFLTCIWFDYQATGPVRYKLADCSLSEAKKSPAILSYVHHGQAIELPVIELDEEFAVASMEDGPSDSEPDIQFEVQIAALKNPVVTDYFSQRLNFRHEVTKEQVDGWAKYTTGDFVTYEEARNRRITLNQDFGIQGPFVVGRREGRRISVQEALTRTGQRWMP